MMLATNFGIYEICQRHAEFIQEGDPRDMEIRSRSLLHLSELIHRFPKLSDPLTLEHSDFPHRSFISRADLAELMTGLVNEEIDYVQFKKGATSPYLHNVLSELWMVVLRSYPRKSQLDKRHKRWFNDV